MATWRGMTEPESVYIDAQVGGKAHDQYIECFRIPCIGPDHMNMIYLMRSIEDDAEFVGRCVPCGRQYRIRIEVKEPAPPRAEGDA